MNITKHFKYIFLFISLCLYWSLPFADGSFLTKETPLSDNANKVGSLVESGSILAEGFLLKTQMPFTPSAVEDSFPIEDFAAAGFFPAEGSYPAKGSYPIKDSNPAEYIDTPYAEEQKVVFEFFFDEPGKIHSALYWLRSYMNTLSNEPYGLAPEFMNIIVLIHGTEIVTLAKKNYSRYKNAVERMRYYEQLGVEFRVCGAAARDYNYTANDFYSFVKIIPSAIVELAHWQNQGYAIIRPLVFEKKYTIEEIR